MVNYWPLSFPDKTTADSVLSSVVDIDHIGMINGQWLVNIAVPYALIDAIKAYVIPFPLFPKRVWFSNSNGVL